MILGVLKENNSETRCAIVPEVVQQWLTTKISEVWVENDLGVLAGYTNKHFQDAGAALKSKSDILSQANILLSVNAPDETTALQAKTGTLWIAAFNPFANKSLIEKMAQHGIQVLALEWVPRTTRAQSMDILSSMATVAGYKAVLLAAMRLPKFFPMFMTAAGSIKPAKVLILGAGVAGLQAIATSRKLGAIVEAFDVRSAVKEEVMSLGAKFVEVEGATDDKAAGGYAVEQTEEYKQRQAEAIHKAALKADVIITTAQIPGKQAPILIKKSTIEQMQAGSLIIDMAASTGGNCEGTINDSDVNINGVTIIGQSNLPSTMPGDASKMFSRNILNLLKIMINKEGQFQLNLQDDIIAGSLISHNGQIIHPRFK